MDSEAKFRPGLFIAKNSNSIWLGFGIYKSQGVFPHGDVGYSMNPFTDDLLEEPEAKFINYKAKWKLVANQN